LTSITAGFDHAWRLVVDGGIVSGPEPAALAKGSMISVTQLFKAVPARLKFLKTERTEQGQCADIVRRLGMAWPEVGFHLTADDRPIAGFTRLFARPKRVAGAHWRDYGTGICRRSDRA
jgi:DNA mismatch repair protein MutL